MDYYHIRTYTPFAGEEADAYIKAETITEYQKKVSNCAGENGMEWYDEEEWLECWGYDKDEDDYDGGDYIKLLDWFEETGRNYPIRIHSANPVGVANMRRIIERNGWKEVF